LYRSDRETEGCGDSGGIEVDDRDLSLLFGGDDSRAIAGKFDDDSTSGEFNFNVASGGKARVK